jgi:APA family basic amino acid/polyamine antiporter
MAQLLGSPLLVLSGWVVAGALTLAGALTYAELAAMLPRVGGEYAFLRVAYGDGPAFLYGWTRFAIASTGSISALAVACATFLAALFPLNQVWVVYRYHLFGQAMTWQFGTQQVLAVAIIAVMSLINCRSVIFVGRLQSLMTILKLSGIFIVVGGVFIFSRTISASNLAAPAGTPAWPGFAPFGTALLAALWAYDSWNQGVMVAGEVREPQRTLPLALTLGVSVVMFTYVIANLAYHYALPFSEVVHSNSTLYREAAPVAAKAAQTFLGPFGLKFVFIIFVVSTLGALNGSVLSFARVPFAMARDGLFFRGFGQVSGGTHVPVFSVMLQGVWASVLAVSGSYDQLTDYAIFASWIFYGLTALSVFVLRRKMPDAVRPFRTPGYPFLPAMLVLVAAWLTWNTIQTRPLESSVGLGLIVAGLPLYWYFRASLRRTMAPAAIESELKEIS